MRKNNLSRNLIFSLILIASVSSYIYVNTSVSISAALGVELSNKTERVEESAKHDAPKTPSFDVEIVKFLLKVAQHYIPASL